MGIVEAIQKIARGMNTIAQSQIEKGGPGSGPRPSSMSAHKKEALRHNTLLEKHKKAYFDSTSLGDENSAKSHSEVARAHGLAAYIHMQAQSLHEKGAKRQGARFGREAYEASDRADALTASLK